MKENITVAQVLTALENTANNYENMVGVELTEEDANNVVRCMKEENKSLEEATKEIVEGILNCLSREIK